MSGPVDAAGWYTSTQIELKNATLPSVLSEDIHNIEHYYDAHGEDAPTAQFLYVSCPDNRKSGSSFFYRMSNMPHTDDIIKQKFTAFAYRARDRTEECNVSTHGYGAVLPSMYIGGALQIQFKDMEEWKTMSLNVEEQRRECETNRYLILPSSPSELPRGTVPVLQNASLWAPELLAMFRDMNICTVEEHRNPTFKGHLNIRSSDAFCEVLESLQAQFEGILISKVKITGVYVEDDGSLQIFQLPHNFYRRRDPTETAFPISPYGLTTLESCSTFEVDFTSTTVHCRDGTGFSFSIPESGKPTPEVPSPGFTPRFTVSIGKIDKETYLYASRIANEPKHPLHNGTRLAVLSDRIYINLNGYRMTLKPVYCKDLRANDHPNWGDGEAGVWTRVLVTINDADTKKTFIDAKPHKDKSTLMDRAGLKNVIETTVKTLCRLMKSCVEKNATVADLLTVVRETTRRRVRGAQLAGISYETRCVNVLQDGLDDPFTVMGNDIAIRREFLDTNDTQYSGIDILVGAETADLRIAIQCKCKVRIEEDDCDSFLRTLAYARNKYPSTVLPGVFVIQKGVMMSRHLLRVMETPGVQVVCVPEDQPTKLLEVIQSLISYLTLS